MSHADFNWNSWVNLRELERREASSDEYAWMFLSAASFAPDPIPWVIELPNRQPAGHLTGPANCIPLSAASFS